MLPPSPISPVPSQELEGKGAVGEEAGRVEKDGSRGADESYLALDKQQQIRISGSSSGSNMGQNGRSET